MISQKLKQLVLILAVGVAGVFVLLLFGDKIFPISLPSSLLQREGIVPLLGKEEIVKAAGTVFLALDFGDGSTQYFSDIPLVTGATAFSILEGAKVPIVYDPSVGAGVFVRQIGEKKNGNGGRYWQYWINEKFAMIAADRYILLAGDAVEWKFAEEQRQ